MENERNLEHEPAQGKPVGPDKGPTTNGGTSGITSQLAKGQRWTSSRKREVVLRILRGEPLDGLSREIGVEIYRLEQWRDKALVGLDEGLKSRKGDPLQVGLDTAMNRIGELTMENELLWTLVRRPSPFAKRRSGK